MMAFAHEILKTEAGLVERITAAIASYRDARQVNAQKKAVFRETLRELKSLGPRELADIGLAASDIERIAREAAYGV